MRIVCIGGGPAGLYFALLMKKARPAAEITVHERNREDDTFGWGVVFSDETLANFEEADPPSYQAIRQSFVNWTDIETFVGGTSVRSRGHGFSGLSRKRLLGILQQRCRELGVVLHFGSEIQDLDRFASADLLVGADGVNSQVRKLLAPRFKPRIDWRRNRFCWLGTTLPLRTFTFIFRESPHGLFQVHAYPFEEGLSTWIVECDEQVWMRARLDRASEAETVATCEQLFADHLEKHRLLSNRSLWRQFPTITCEHWHHDRVVLLGDAAHTAHFSIGSGTKLAMEDAMALVGALQSEAGEIRGALAAYENARRVDVLKLQKTAQTSLEWFENASRYLRQHPLQFTFNLMTRSKRITYENLRQRDPELVARADAWFQDAAKGGRASDGSTPPPIFTPFSVRGLTLGNRIVVSPMCQYSAVEGTPNDWHLVHLGSRAVGGAGLVLTEMTNVSPEGRISPGCAGLYAPGHLEAWRRIVDFVHQHTRSKIGVQLAHAGRKGSVDHPWEGPDEPLRDRAWETVAPSPIPFEPHWPPPREMDRAAMDRILQAFVRAVEMAAAAGFDWLELHMAHGYLLSSFISPLSNRRGDEYGGSLGNRMRYPLEILAAARAAWPESRPVSVRISATDWVDQGGLTPTDSVEVARLLKEEGCDLVDVSSGGTSPEGRPEYGRMYQVPLADRIRHEVGIPVMAVGAIQGADHANTVILAGRADLALLARPHLYDPYLTLHAATEGGYPDAPWPGPYLAGRPRPAP